MSGNICRYRMYPRIRKALDRLGGVPVWEPSMSTIAPLSRQAFIQATSLASRSSCSRTR